MTPAASRLDRLIAAYPLLLAYVLLLILYAFETTRHSSPWLFTDELQWAEQSRGVAHHGVEQLRGQRVPFDSLYAYLIAPAWWASTTSGGYAAAKYINAIVMAASLFPAYALARLFVPRWVAIACGIAAAGIPAAAYIDLLIPEPFAYFWSTLALWLIARALLRPTRRTAIAAAIVVLLAPAVRTELTVLIVAAAVAGAIVFATGERGRRLIASWTWRERIGVVLLIAGAAIWLGALGNHHSTSWEIGTHFHHRLFTYGLWAIGAFAIGVGVLPVVIALTWLFGNRFRTADERVLGGLFIGGVLAFCAYTAVKASYLSTTFAIRVEERNLIYVAPVLFAVVGRWALSPRVRIVPLALATAAVWYLLDTTPYHNTEHYYSDAPGLSVLQWLNQKIYFTTTDARRLLFGILIGTVVALVLAEAARRRGLRQAALPAGVLLAVAVIGWNLWGQIAAASASNTFARNSVALLPKPLSWIDETTRNAPSFYLGQSMAGSDQFWALEFWNQSLGEVWSTDATAPGPGPVRTPNYLDTSGALDPQLPVDWLVAGPGVDPAGQLKQTAGFWRLYHVPHPIRIADAVGNISTDGANWMGTSAFYYRFTSAGTKPGTAVVTVSRNPAACGGFPPSLITIKLSRLWVNGDGQPAPKRVLATRRVLIHSNPCETKTVRIPARAPYRIDVTANRTFQPSEFDQRQLSAQVTFGFEP